ncbi:Microtubule-nucleating Tub4p (gamma-tubulin) complex component [Blastocladiella emersonii ATCC 22665]|nr:Microtubule-nucleating Tub4p (gamma-tubulin) complex component [Blastocladiella emersonii ATCC 22665]
MQTSQEDPVSAQIVRLVDALVRAQIPHLPASQDSAFQSGVFNTTGSASIRMAPPASQSEVVIEDSIKKHLVRTQHSTEAALRFINLSQRLSHSTLLNRRWAILHFLQAVSVHVAHSDDSAIGLSVATLSQLPSLATLNLSSARLPLPSNNASANSLLRDSPTPTGSPSRRNRTASKTFLPGDRTGFETYLESENHSYQIPEAMIIKDLLFVFQGIDGRLIKWDAARNEYVIDPSVGIPRPTRDLVLRLSEIGFHYRTVAAFLKSERDNPSTGLVRQSLCSAVESELAHFFRLLAVLEAAAARGEMTLRRLWLWSTEPTQRLRLMVAIIAGIQAHNVAGGQLVNHVHMFAHHGDLALQSFVQQLLKAMCVPFFAMIRRWVYEGELVDPYNEFFVRAQQHVSDDKWWDYKYVKDNDMVPGLIERPLPKKILLIGKSLNFLRFHAKDHAWVAMRSRLGQQAVGLEYGDLYLFEQSIDAAFKVTSDRLVQRLYGEFKLKEHLLALKRYLLMGQGDFIQVLMETLDPTLSKPASMLQRHTLTSGLELAIRSSSAQYEDKDILNRLDTRTWNPSAGDIGWDVFSLDYHLDAPLNTVITRESLEFYLRVFNFLWRLKRAERVLNRGWREHHREARRYAHLPAVLGALNRLHIRWSEMIHFIAELQSYLVSEVMETLWVKLVAELEKDGLDMELIIRAHHRYLNNIAVGCLIAGNAETGSNFFERFTRIFFAVHQVQAARDRLIDYAQAELEAHTAAARTRHRQAWDLDLDHDPMATAMPSGEFTSAQNAQFRRPVRSLEEIETQFKTAGDSFKMTLGEILGELASHPNDSLRNLAARLNFNEFYMIAQKREPQLVEATARTASDVISSKHPEIPGYTIQRIIGRGSFGIVYLASHAASGTQVAIKSLDKLRRRPRASSVSNFTAECDLLLSLQHAARHPNIIAVYEAVDDAAATHLCMEYVPRGDLHVALARHGAFPEPRVRELATQLLSAVGHLHAHGIVHRDIKLDNVLVAADGTVRLADFGLATRYTAGRALASFAGSPPFAAPEVHFGWEFIGPEADVWSLGVVVYGMATATLPFDGKDLATLRRAVWAANPRLPAAFSPELVMFLRRAFARNPAHRADIGVLEDTPWARGTRLPSLAHAVACDMGPVAAVPTHALGEDNEEEDGGEPTRGRSRVHPALAPPPSARSRSESTRGAARPLLPLPTMPVARSRVRAHSVDSTLLRNGGGGPAGGMGLAPTSWLDGFAGKMAGHRLLGGNDAGGGGGDGGFGGSMRRLLDSITSSFGGGGGGSTALGDGPICPSDCGTVRSRRGTALQGFAARLGGGPGGGTAVIPEEDGGEMDLEAGGSEDAGAVLLPPPQSHPRRTEPESLLPTKLEYEPPRSTPLAARVSRWWWRGSLCVSLCVVVVAIVLWRSSGQGSPESAHA